MIFLGRLSATFFLLLTVSVGCSASILQNDDYETTLKNKIEGQKFDTKSFAMEHVMDAHQWHIASYNGHPIAIPLPIILLDNGRIVTFMSSEFEHGDKVVSKGDSHYVIKHEKIYKTDAKGTLFMDDEGHPTNPKPLDFSITRNIASMLFVAILLLLLFLIMAKSYRRSVIPKGLPSFLEPLVLFVRDNIAIPNIGEDKYKRFMPYLLTVFFFIWLNNLVGLLPIPPGGANVTGNIALTMVLALLTFIITNISGNKNYWRHIFDPLGSSFPWQGKIMLYLVLVPVEVIGIFTKPFALMVRLFANITAGHIIILSLTCLVFVFKTSLVSIATIPFILFMNCIELLVAVLQAYVFTLLSALFIGLAVKDHH